MSFIIFTIMELQYGICLSTVSLFSDLPVSVLYVHVCAAFPTLVTAASCSDPVVDLQSANPCTAGVNCDPNNVLSFYRSDDILISSDVQLNCDAATVSLKALKQCEQPHRFNTRMIPTSNYMVNFCGLLYVSPNCRFRPRISCGERLP